MTRFQWITSFALLAVLTTGTCVFAQGNGGRRGGGPGGGPGSQTQGPAGQGLGRGGFGLGPAVRGLDLSDAQREQVRAIVAKARADSRPLADRLRQATEARRKAVATLPVDENQIRTTTQALTAVQADLAVARAHVQSDIFALLTPDQQAKATEARERRESRVTERRSRVEQRRQERRSNN